LFLGANLIITIMKLFSRNMRKRTALYIVTTILIVGGLVGTIPTLYYRWTNSGTATGSGPIVSASPLVTTPSGLPETPQTPVVSGEPIGIDIPSLKINLVVVPGYYNAKTGAWNLSDTEAQFATPSILPNNVTGNTIIYGHYRLQVFALLHLIKPGATATVTTSNGYSFTYTYTGTYAVSPTNTSVYDYKGAPILTVQTCSGAYFQNRQMYQFNLLSYQKTS
jgi:sortase (surface protein transpeptidase)